jgi:mannose-6-phosphate isomerase-like protein (cupin superfamily)
MAQTSVHKVNSNSSPTGRMGQKYLACGIGLAMRLWESVEPGNDRESSQRDYETVGYVIKGRAELKLGQQTLLLEPGDSWIVPRGAEHSYRVLETFSAIEATHPPALVHGRDEIE